MYDTDSTVTITIKLTNCGNTTTTNNWKIEIPMESSTVPIIYLNT